MFKDYSPTDEHVLSRKVEVGVQLQVPGPLLHPLLLDVYVKLKEKINLLHHNFGMSECCICHENRPALKLPCLYRPWLSAHKEKETMYSLNGCMAARQSWYNDNTQNNTPSTLYWVPNHFSLRGHWPSCSGDNSIRLAFSGVSKDKAALITCAHTHKCILAVNHS